MPASRSGAPRNSPRAATPAAPSAGSLDRGKAPPAAKLRADAIARALAQSYPNAHCELVFSTPHELLIATILSAQATDVSVNKATPALFKAFPTPPDYARATPEQIEPFIKTIGLFRNKAKAVQSSMSDIVLRFNGKVPQTMDELLTLRGVARKTANVVLGNAFAINVGFVVDTHVERLSKRLGLVPTTAKVAQIEQRLMKLFPQSAWCDTSHKLIFHGRQACKARGVQCGTHPICAEFGVRCELKVTAKSQA